MIAEFPKSLYSCDYAEIERMVTVTGRIDPNKMATVNSPAEERAARAQGFRMLSDPADFQLPADVSLSDLIPPNWPELSWAELRALALKLGGAANITKPDAIALIGSKAPKSQ